MLLKIISLLKEILAELKGIRAALNEHDMQPTPLEEELLDNSDAKRMLKIGDKTLYRWRKEKLISSLIVGKKRYYLKAELIKIRDKLQDKSGF